MPKTTLEGLDLLENPLRLSFILAKGISYSVPNFW